MEKLDIPVRQKKVNITIEYCVPCDYSECALTVARDLIKNYQHVINRLALKMGSKGVFVVAVDERVIFSRKTVGRHPRPGEVLQSFKELVGPDIPTYTA